MYDSLYLALAELRTCRLVTADRTLINALKHGALAPRLCWVEDLAR